MMRRDARLVAILSILLISVLIPRIDNARARAQDTGDAPAPAPAVVFTWPDQVVWRGPGLLVVLTGGQPYVLDGPALDDSPRAWRLGGDVRAAPHAGMVLAVVDAEYRVLAQTTLSPPPTPTASPTPAPAVVPRRYLPVLLKSAALP